MKVKPGCACAHRGDRLRPERRRRQAPGALEDLGQQQHRHVAAHAVALPGDRRQLRHQRRLQRRIGIVELQRVRPAGEVGIAPMGQDPRSLLRLGPPVIAGGGRQVGLAALDVEIGMGPDPGMIERRVVGHEVEHQPQAALGEPGAEARERRRPAQRFIDLVAGDGEARSRDIVFGQIGQRRLELGAPRGRVAARHRPALPGPSARRSAARSSRSRRRAMSSRTSSSTSARVIGLPGLGRQPIAARPAC